MSVIDLMNIARHYEVRSYVYVMAGHTVQFLIMEWTIEKK